MPLILEVNALIFLPSPTFWIHRRVLYSALQISSTNEGIESLIWNRIMLHAIIKSYIS